LYSFFKTFILANPEEYELKNGDNEINVTYPLYIMLSLYIFLIYLKTATSIYMAFLFIGAAWFALIVFRTFVFVGGRENS
jgi:predicted lysophospholipase L1 biosynthesis ABC-type transport system permease subunit